MPSLTFSIDPFLIDKGGRKVFRNQPGILMLHLGHPLMRKACGALIRRRYPGYAGASRLTASYGEIPSGDDAKIWIHFEEMAVNKLREAFHFWVRSLCFPVKNGKLLAPLPHIPAMKARRKSEPLCPEDREMAEEIYTDVIPDLKKALLAHQTKLQELVVTQLASAQQTAKDDENLRFQSRDGELSTLIRSKTIAAKQRELESIKRELSNFQAFLWEEDEKQYEDNLIAQKAMLERELKNDLEHYEELRNQLKRERERITQYLIPNRYAMDGDVQIYPIAVEIVLPRKGASK